jgi:hypothetical protein
MPHPALTPNRTAPAITGGASGIGLVGRGLRGQS